MTIKTTISPSSFFRTDKAYTNGCAKTKTSLRQKGRDYLKEAAASEPITFADKGPIAGIIRTNFRTSRVTSVRAETHTPKNRTLSPEINPELVRFAALDPTFLRMHL